jgi:hypothetical protein
MYTKDSWIEKAKQIHNDRYDYSKVVYTGALQTVIVICKIHGDFKQRASTHLSKSGCPTCSYEKSSKDQLKTLENFINDAKKKHNDIYSYDKVIYKGSSAKIIIECRLHGMFMQSPNNHLAGTGCKKCKYLVRTKTQDNFITDAVAVHGARYDYSKVIYKNGSTEVEIVCLLHGSFMQKPYKHLQKHGCKSCSNMHSRISIEWLDFIASGNDIHIQHALNGGEYTIGKYKIDGFCEATNTCYEFHGTMWHAHPDYCNTNAYNRITKKFNADIYRITLEREDYIRRQGYNLVVMWEHEWKNICRSYLS